MSSKSLLINYFKFSVDSTGPGPNSSHGSFVTSHHLSPIELQALLFLQAPLIPRLSRAPGPEFEYIDRRVRIYQAWSLASNLELSSALFVVQDFDPSLNTTPMHHILMPTRKIPTVRRREVTRRIKSHFIIPNDDIKNDLDTLTAVQTYSIRERPKNSLRLRINWIEIYHRVFTSQAESSETGPFMLHLQETVSECINRVREGHTISMSTL